MSLRKALTVLFLVALFFGCDSGPGPNEDPMVSFSIAPTEPRAGKAITFSADANDPDGSIQKYKWSTEDGAEGQGATFSHAFAEKGTYTVTLKVIDNREGTATARKTVDVRQRYSEVEVTGIEVRDMPFTTDSGEGWDYTTGPDVYVIAYNTSDETREMTSEVYYEDAGPSDLPLIYEDMPFTVDDLSKEYSLNIWDYDSSTDDEYIGGVKYNFSSMIGSYPDKKLIQAGGIEYKIKLKWGN